MSSVSPPPDNGSLVARTTPTSPSEDGSAPKTSNRATRSYGPPRPCAWCDKMFTPARPWSRKNGHQRFCNRSCSAKWRMAQPENVAKVHTPEVAARRGRSRAAWLAAGSEQALAEIARIAALNPTTRPEVREKISRRLKSIGHGPSVRGGNGRGLTEPQQQMLDALGPTWVPEFALSLGPRTPGYPTHYKLDLAQPELRVAIELDGNTHRSRRTLDVKKDAKVASLGWTVLRFWNAEITDWMASGMPTDGSVSTTLAQHGIRPTRPPDC